MGGVDLSLPALALREAGCRASLRAFPNAEGWRICDSPRVVSLYNSGPPYIRRVVESCCC